MHIRICRQADSTAHRRQLEMTMEQSPFLSTPSHPPFVLPFPTAFLTTLSPFSLSCSYPSSFHLPFLPPQIQPEGLGSAIPVGPGGARHAKRFLVHFEAEIKQFSICILVLFNRFYYKLCWISSQSVACGGKNIGIAPTGFWLWGQSPPCSWRAMITACQMWVIYMKTMYPINMHIKIQ